MPIFLSITTAPTDIYTLSLHDALPIFPTAYRDLVSYQFRLGPRRLWSCLGHQWNSVVERMRSRCCWSASQCANWASDRKSTRLNSSHPSISYAVFCLKKKKTPHTHRST